MTLESDRWVCSKCGTTGATPLSGFTLVDQRYAIGYCDQCNEPNPKTPRKRARATQSLIRERFFDPEAFERRRERDELASLIQEFGRGTSTVSLSDNKIVRLVALWDKYGFPGWTPSPQIREEAAKVEASKAAVAAARTSHKRRR